LDEREFELINIIGAELVPNQRDISRQMDLSLGMTNMLIHRLLTKGYIRIKQLNKKKVEYILTPKGFAEKMQKSIKYTMKTINSIGLIKKTLADILTKAYEAGHRKFYILGESDLAGLIEIVLKENFNEAYEVMHVSEITSVLSDGVVLVCREDVVVDVPGVKTLDMIHELAKDEAVISERGAA
jgi:DNA-binding MarR family transcriptional regulator